MIEILTYPLQDSLSLAFAELGNQPLFGIVIILAIVAAVYAVTSWQNVIGRVSPAFGYGNKVILSKCVPQSFAASTVCATMPEILKATIPIFRSKGRGQISSFRTLPGLRRLMLLWIGFPPSAPAIPSILFSTIRVAALPVAGLLDRLLTMPIVITVSSGANLIRIFVFPTLLYFFGLLRIILSPLSITGVAAFLALVANAADAFLCFAKVFGGSRVLNAAFLAAPHGDNQHLKFSLYGLVGRRWEGVQGSLFSRLMTSDLSHRPIIAHPGGLR